MKRISYPSLAFAAVVALGLVASSLAIAADGRDCVPPVHTPVANGVVMATRVFNDCPTSNLSFFDGYPGQIWIRDSDPFSFCPGWANLHVWSFSEDGGLTPAVFENCSGYKFHASLVLSPFPGTVVGPAEAGLRLSPWWALDVDGRFMVRAGAPYGNGEIACFGGRLPYFNFTTAYGLVYENDQAIYMEIVYHPHSLTEGDPATITYSVNWKGVWYSSGPLPWDWGNWSSEDPPHGQWGELFPSRVGGYFQAPSGGGFEFWDWIATWWNVGYNDNPTAAVRRTWGQVKTLYR
jgi:hypothetical protein